MYRRSLRCADGKFRYDEIRNLYVGQLAFNWMQDLTGQKIRAGVETKIKSFAKGNLKHATEVLSALWEIANSDGDVQAPSGSEQIVSQFRLRLL